MTTKTINFSKYSSIKIGGEIEVSLLEKPSDFTDKYYLLGSCNNTLIGTQPPPLMMRCLKSWRLGRIHLKFAPLTIITIILPMSEP